jgi:tetratricopeptide (TPR) repeat protein
MSETEQLTKDEFHKKMGVELFNSVWDLMEKDLRTPEENDLMIHAAHASRYHWGEIGTPVNFVRGEWQISRVYSLLGRPESAIHHAQRCLEICQEHNIGDFDLAYAYEALARAYAVAQQADECQRYLVLAEQLGNQIQEKEAQELLFNDLKTIPEVN